MTEIYLHIVARMARILICVSMIRQGVLTHLDVADASFDDVIALLSAAGRPLTLLFDEPPPPSPAPSPVPVAGAGRSTVRLTTIPSCAHMDDVGSFQSYMAIPVVHGMWFLNDRRLRSSHAGADQQRLAGRGAA